MNNVDALRISQQRDDICEWVVARFRELMEEDRIDDAPRYAEIRERKRRRHLRGAPVSKGCERSLPCRFWLLIRYPWTARLHGRLGSRGASGRPAGPKVPLCREEDSCRLSVCCLSLRSRNRRLSYHQLISTRSEVASRM